MTLTPFQQLVSGRRSIRRYLPKPVEREKIAACLDAARLAPSAENAQTWRFLVIDDPDLKARFAREAFTGIYGMTKFAAEAPVLVLILSRPDIMANRLSSDRTLLGESPVYITGGEARTIVDWLSK